MINMTEEYEKSKILPLPGDYKTLIGDIREAGYKFPRFLDFNAKQKHVLLRHDVDISIQSAHKLAQVENQLGIHSAYFILLRSDFYNPFSRENTERLRSIIDLGHDIGLHIDLSVYECGPDEIHRYVIEEARMLGELLKIPIYLVSFHRPTTIMRDIAYQQIKLPGFVSLYEPSLFKDIGFISDSRGAWYHGHPLDHDAFKEKKAFQLLTHPIWWVDIKDNNAVDLLHRFSNDRVEKYLDRFKDEFSIMRSE